MTDSANVVPIIDTSNSMTFNGYVAITKRSSKAFVSYAQPGDGLAVVNYDSTARTTYSAGSSLATVDQNLSQAIAAANAIEALTFTGSATAIGSGLIAAATFLDPATTPKAMILLSDGYQNTGPNPLDNLPAYPVYSCAMGPNADITLMQQIATQTGGVYYNAPYPSTMMFIYNEIRSQPTFVQSILNKQNNILPNGYALVPATVAADNAGGQFGIVWDDAALSYTASANPTSTQIGITIVQPNGQIYPIAPSIVGDGYVIFNVPNPTDGIWYAQVISGASGKNIQVTTGGFEFPNNPEAAPKLNVTADSFMAGSPLKVSAHVTEGDTKIKDLHVTATVLRPTISVANAIKKYSHELQHLKMPANFQGTGADPHIARLAMLRQTLLPHQDILAHRETPIHFQQDKKGDHLAHMTDTDHAGDYMVKVEATGISQKTNRAFARTKLITVSGHPNPK
jgi:hypothetical protein